MEDLGSISSLGHVHFEKIRTKVMQSLGYNTYGANPKLQLSCICPSACDPEFWCAYETILSWRKFTTPEMSDFVMDQIAEGNKMTPGPCASITKVMHKLGWQWINAGIVLDENRLPLSIRDCPIQELFVRVRQAWQTAVLSEIEKLRQTMKHLSKACVASTIKEYDTWNPEEQGILRCALNGTLYTNDAIVHTGKVESSDCSFCNATDSCRHRHWECPYFEEIRSQCLSQLPFEIKDLPDSMVLHGWIPKNPFVQELKSLLCNLPNLAHTHFVPQKFNKTDKCVEIFTDGSCINPTKPDQRVATWGAVIWVDNGFSTIAEGGVPGYHQTSLRGEIWAAVAAMSFAVQQQVQIRIWIDNQTVCNFIQRLLAETHNVVNPQGKDADLWEWLERQFETAKPFIKQVVKVRSHVKDDAKDEFESWVFLGNDSADAAAKKARTNLPQQIWKILDKVVEKDIENDNLRRAIHTLFVKVGQKAVQTQPTKKPSEPHGTHLTEAMEVDKNMVALSKLTLDEIPQHLLTDETRFLITWLESIVTGNAPARWVTWHQLLIDYQFSSGKTMEKRWLQTGRLCIQISCNVVLSKPFRGSESSEFELDRVDSFLKQWATRIPARNLQRDLGEVPRAMP